jgi:hypothetical protein
MKYLKKFTLFEASIKDIEKIFSDFNDYFTVAFEFELETDDRSNINIRIEDIDEDTIEEVADITTSELKIRSKKDRDCVNDILLNLLDMIQNDDFSNIYEIFDKSNFETDREKEIAKHFKELLLSYVSVADLDYMIEMTKKHLPNFTKNWENEIEYVGDATLERGIEIKLKEYVKGLDTALKMINDFYNDLENQEYWMFKESTGLHINIGSTKNVDWNPIKGLLFLNDFTESDYIPFTFKDMTWRMKNNYCGSLLKIIKEIEPELKQEIKSSINLNDIEGTERILNAFLNKKIDQVGYKYFGFNIGKIKHNYIEFRYAGGIIKKETLIEKLKYFSFITYLMSNKDYKRKEYLKKLYKFVETL